MQVDIDGKSARRTVRTVARFLRALLLSVYGGCVALARRLQDVAGGASRRTRRAGRALQSRANGTLGSERVSELGEQVVAALFGVRRQLSVVALLSAPLLAAGTGWWVATTYGYRRVESWAVGTWTGANPEPLVFAGAAAIVALAGLFAAFNSGLVPATVLAMAPTFGIGFARYGQSVEYYGLVSIPDAAAIGLLVAVVVGVPLGVTGFLFGTAVRWVAGYVLDGSAIGGALAER